jgi:hypothetical protein
LERLATSLRAVNLGALALVPTADGAAMVDPVEMEAKAATAAKVVVEPEAAYALPRTQSY